MKKLIWKEGTSIGELVEKIIENMKIKIVQNK